MRKLLVYVPTFRGSERLEIFVKRYVEEVKGLENEVYLHINDNSSDFLVPAGPLLSPELGILTNNESNIGAAKNVNKVFTFNNKYEYTWVLGDDDILTKGSLKRLIKLLNEKSPDYIFVNTVTFPDKIKDEVIKLFFKQSFLPLKQGRIKSRKSKKVIEIPFNQLIDPEVDEVMLGSIMCGVFKTDLVKDHSSINFPNDAKLSVWSSYPHVINYANSLPPGAKSVYDPFLYTFNFWNGGNTWKKELDVVVALGILNSIKHFSENGHVDSIQEAKLIKHYLCISSSSRKKLYEINDDAINKQFAAVSPYLMSRLNKHSFSSKSDLCVGIIIKLWLRKVIPKRLFEKLRVVRTQFS